MSTRKLYYKDSYLHTFTGQVVATKPGWVALNQTAFYPEGGGQPADHGWLQGQRVTDTQIDEQGTVWHQVALEPTVGETVEGRIDWLRRFDHMQQHTAQHVLSQVFMQLFGAETVGFHLGDQSVTIDLAGPELDTTALEQAEALANAKLRSKAPVNCFEVSPQGLPAELRKLPQVDVEIRLVEIGDFDLCPCGGTHVRDLGEIGLLKILGSERKRGNLRVSFAAGQRAYRDYNQKHDQLASLSALLSEPIANVAVAVERQQAKLHELERENNRLREQVLVLEGQELLGTAQDRGKAQLIVQEIEHSLDEAKFLAKFLAEQGPNVILFGLPGEPYRLVAAASANIKVPLGRLLKDSVNEYQGKGGGSPTSAQGAVPRAVGPDALANLAQAYRQALGCS